MKVFISWSGIRSKHIAGGLHKLLPDIIQNTRPFMSKHDIDAGSRWTDRLNSELSETNFGILCLTPENLASPWLLYEAGALGKSLGVSRVCPLYYDITPDDVKWPLAQFQGGQFDKEGIKTIVDSLNNSQSENQLTSERIERCLDRIWPEFEEVINSIPPDNNNEPVPERSERDVLNEILLIVRDQQRKRNPDSNLESLISRAASVVARAQNLVKLSEDEKRWNQESQINLQSLDSELYKLVRELGSSYTISNDLGAFRESLAIMQGQETSKVIDVVRTIEKLTYGLLRSLNTKNAATEAMALF